MLYSLQPEIYKNEVYTLYHGYLNINKMLTSIINYPQKLILYARLAIITCIYAQEHTEVVAVDSVIDSAAQATYICGSGVVLS